MSKLYAYIVRIENEIQFLKEEIEQIKNLISHTYVRSDAKFRLIEAIKEHHNFRSKREWASCADVSMGTFYRLERDVISELENEGYQVVYKPVTSGRKLRVYRYEILLIR